jgi:hypothetical protein
MLALRKAGVKDATERDAAQMIQVGRDDHFCDGMSGVATEARTGPALHRMPTTTHIDRRPLSELIQNYSVSNDA